MSIPQQVNLVQNFEEDDSAIMFFIAENNEKLFYIFL